MISEYHEYAFSYIEKTAQLYPQVNSITLLDRVRKAAKWANKKHGERRTPCSECGKKKYTISDRVDHHICFDCYVGHDTQEIMMQNWGSR